MKKIDFEYDYALQHPYNLFDGAIVRKQSCKEKPTKNSEITTTWYKVKIRHDTRIFEQIEESEVPNVKNNLVGDYMLNLRSGTVSVYMGNDKINSSIMKSVEDDEKLDAIRKMVGLI